MAATQYGAGSPSRVETISSDLFIHTQRHGIFSREVVRVYFRDTVGFISVGSDGSLSEATRGKTTFLWSSLYTNEKKPLRQALSRYLASSDELREDMTSYEDELAEEIAHRI